ncbi:hypothetical protein [Clavibacter tessellarius]|uniref:hypothetical protein n=1 Tax=Clavibacter tessellarius TaxID=31965 RepID=UPI0039BF6C18
MLANRLRGRGLSLAEAREVLDGAEIDPDIAEETLARYVSLQYIDEAALAEQILHTHLDRKGLGRRSVEMEMRRRKLDPSSSRRRWPSSRTTSCPAPPRSP